MKLFFVPTLYAISLALIGVACSSPVAAQSDSTFAPKQSWPVRLRYQLTATSIPSTLPKFVPYSHTVTYSYHVKPGRVVDEPLQRYFSLVGVPNEKTLRVSVGEEFLEAGKDYQYDWENNRVHILNSTFLQPAVRITATYNVLR